MPTLEPDRWRDARVLVVVAHPDDEVLGCGALLARLHDVRVVHVTDGVPPDPEAAARHGLASPSAYADARRAEAVAALGMAGVTADQLTGLGIGDQRAPGHLAAIAEALRPRLAAADIVLTHAYEGGHGDHDAVAFAVHAAGRLSGGRPLLMEMPFYHAGPDGWVRQRFLPVPKHSTFSRGREKVPGRADEGTHGPADPLIPAVADRLPPAGEGAVLGREVLHALTPEERALKARMIAAHATQADTLGDFPLDAERFRAAPSYDFSARPHDGPLLYERHDWSLDWPAWQACVAAACRTLNLSPCAD